MKGNGIPHLYTYTCPFTGPNTVTRGGKFCGGIAGGRPFPDPVRGARVVRRW